jgi:hypothetical protein
MGPETVCHLTKIIISLVTLLAGWRQFTNEIILAGDRLVRPCYWRSFPHTVSPYLGLFISTTFLLSPLEALCNRGLPKAYSPLDSALNPSSLLVLLELNITAVVS